jgi:hypothetical protein
MVNGIEPNGEAGALMDALLSDNTPLGPMPHKEQGTSPKQADPGHELRASSDPG